jgi:outer membrane cobalamin receptor
MKSFIYWEDLDQDSLIEPANRDVDQAGIEFKILLKLPYLSHGMSLVYQEIVPELPLQPQFLLHNSLNINHQKWSLQIDQYYSSTRYLNDHKLRGYLLFSSKLSYQSNQWEIFAQVENLFDATYERIPYHPEEGRRYSIGGSLTHYTHSDIAH